MHPYEIALLIVSTIAVPVVAALFTLKLTDLVRVIVGRINGATRYHTVYKFRHEVILFGISVGVLTLAISGFNNPVPPSAQALNWIMFGIALSSALIVDAIWTFRKRHQLPVLIAEEERRHGGDDPVLGGRRSTDPQ